MSEEHVQIKQNGEILYLTLNRPEASNAISLKMVDQLCGSLEDADEDSSVRVVVLKGSGEHFCAGGDVKAMKDQTGMFAGEPNELRMRYQRGIQRIPKAIEAFQKPIIAQIQGACIGAGLDLACMCDMRVAGPKARFAETFSKLALVPGDGGSFFLQRVVGYAKAMEMFLTADFYQSLQAKEMGLVNILVEKNDEKDLELAVNQLCEKIILQAPISLSMTKMALKRGRTEGLNSQLELLAALQGITQRTQDHQAAIDSLISKSGPVSFQGE
jgi:enoyl-CoA hydratase/carnithine racemase